ILAAGLSNIACILTAGLGNFMFTHPLVKLFLSFSHYNNGHKPMPSSTKLCTLSPVSAWLFYGCPSIVNETGYCILLKAKIWYPPSMIYVIRSNNEAHLLIHWKH